MNRPFIEPTSTVTKINVTPIIDVALVLVIILMVTAPMIAVSDVDVSLPPAETRSLEATHRVTLTIGHNGELAVDDDVVDYGRVRAVLSARFATMKDDNVLVVRADEGVPYVTVQDMVSTAKAAGAKRIAIATRQRGNQNE
ncbi:MAG TPA: biopolymer transporter ExbD [Candidatus Krumholzibacteria bacterium]|nr:biopolymer transporter ExbD [Candidatus Krumholzibacteria bacterium]